MTTHLVLSTDLHCKSENYLGELYKQYYVKILLNSIQDWVASISEIEPKYFADGEDAYAMKRDLTGLKLEVGFYFSIIAKSKAPSLSMQARLHRQSFY